MLPRIKLWLLILATGCALILGHASSAQAQLPALFLLQEKTLICLCRAPFCPTDCRNSKNA